VLRGGGVMTGLLSAAGGRSLFGFGSLRVGCDLRGKVCAAAEVVIYIAQKNLVAG
jgi:hypothetical protein